MRSAESESDHDLARLLAVEAGQLLQQVRGEFEPLEGLDRMRRLKLGDVGDQLANDYILAQLALARADDAVLSEEAFDDRVRVDRDRVWIVDPLDGTAEFRAGRDEYAVHVALWTRGYGLTAAAISLPDRDRTWCTGDDHRALPPLDFNQPIRLVVSRSHVPTGTDVIISRLTDSIKSAGYLNVEVTTYSVGSVGAKVDELLVANAAAYIFTGGLSEWDIAAPFAVAQEQGFVARDIHGACFDYNQSVPRAPSGFVAHPALADYLAAAVIGSGL